MRKQMESKGHLKNLN